MTGFVPPYPKPHRGKASLFKRFVSGWNSWIHTLADTSYTMKLGEIRLPKLHMFVANDPTIVARVMDDAEGEFPKHPLLNDLLDPLIGDSVFSANGQRWRDQREMVNPAFAHTNLKLVFATMRDAVDELVARVSALDLDQPIRIDPLMTHVAADIIFRTLFSMRLDEAGAREIHEAFHAYQRGIQPSAMLRLYGLPLLGYERRAQRAAARIHKVFAPIVEARHKAAQRGEASLQEDILATLIAARHPKTGEPFTAQELVDQISTIFLAGHETAASAMTWALYLLAESPDVQDAVRAEARAAWGARPIDFADLRQLKLTRDVFRETLRLYPPVSFFLRAVTRPTEMRGKAMSPGSVIVVSPWLIQRNADQWRCPHAFVPERFADPAKSEACRHAYMPFGRGPRICIGAGFAQQEALLVLASLIRAFRVAPVAGETPEPISRLTLRPKHGLRLLLSRVD